MSPTTPPSLTLDDARGLVRDGALWERGERLWQQGALADPRQRGLVLLGEVRGSEPQPYSVSLEAPPPGRRRWAWRCTCPYFEIYGGPCKHDVTLLLQWVHAPESFAVEASLDERLAGERRAEWLVLIRDALHDDPALRRLLALEPEPKRPLGRPLSLAPYEEQLYYARRRYAEQPDKQKQLFQGVLETAAGYLRVGDAANAARLTTLLVGELLALPGRARPLDGLLLESLTLLEAAVLGATWPAGEQGSWLARAMGWWEESEPALADRLMDLILHGYRESDSATVERWLRGLLRKPVQGNRLSSAGWRQRVLAFLLAFYEHAGRAQAFLDLCWEEGEDALAARKLVERGDLPEVERMAAQGLGSSDAHREVAAALDLAGHPAEARRVAAAGLRYSDRGRGALLAWLAARALERGEDEQALSLAREGWAQGASLERYTLLREAAQRAEAWPDLRRDLHAALEHRGELALLIEILADEEEWQAAAALLPQSGPRRDELSEAIARGMAPHHPVDALHLLFDLADQRTDGRSRSAYARAAQALLAARSHAWATGLEDEYRAALRTFRENHARRSALLDEMERAGVGP